MRATGGLLLGCLLTMHGHSCTPALMLWWWTSSHLHLLMSQTFYRIMTGEDEIRFQIIQDASHLMSSDQALNWADSNQSDRGSPVTADMMADIRKTWTIEKNGLIWINHWCKHILVRRLNINASKLFIFFGWKTVSKGWLVDTWNQHLTV